MEDVDGPEVGHKRRGGADHPGAQVSDDKAPGTVEGVVVCGEYLGDERHGRVYA